MQCTIWHSLDLLQIACIILDESNDYRAEIRVRKVMTSTFAYIERQFSLSARNIACVARDTNQWSIGYELQNQPPFWSMFVDHARALNNQNKPLGTNVGALLPKRWQQRYYNLPNKISVRKSTSTSHSRDWYVIPPYFQCCHRNDANLSMAREDIMVFSLRKVNVTNCIPNVQNVCCRDVFPNLMPRMLVNIHFQKWPLQFWQTFYTIVIRGLKPRLRKQS